MVHLLKLGLIVLLFFLTSAARADDLSTFRLAQIAAVRIYAGLSVNNPVTAGSITLAGDVQGAGNANTVNNLSGVGGAPVGVTAPALTFGASTANPAITQASTSGATPQPLTIASQASTAGATANGAAIVLNVSAPGASGTDAGTQIQSNGTAFALLQRYNKTGGTGAIYLGNAAGAPSAANYTFYSDGTNGLINAPVQGILRVSNAGTGPLAWNGNSLQLFSDASFALGGGAGVVGWGPVTTIPTSNPSTGIVLWATSSELAGISSTGQEVDLQMGVAPGLAQLAQLSTSSSSGAGGNTMTIAAQNGQPATGATHNGGNGGALVLTSGNGGTSGSATAGVAAPLNLQNGGTTTLSIGPTASSGGPAAIGLANTSVSITASSNTTFTLTATQYQNPMIVLTGTLTSAAVATIALPNVTAMWWFDYSAVTFTSGTIKWQCGGGAATPTGVSSLVNTSEIAMVSCRATTVSLHTILDSVVEPDWRYAASIANDPYDIRRRAA